VSDDLDAVLDNLPWHALSGPQASFTENLGTRAYRYRRPVGLFFACESLDIDGWAALTELAGPKGTIVLFQPDIGPVPEGLNELGRFPTWQMVADGPPTTAVPRSLSGLEVVQLGVDDVDEMLTLTALTQPGPFFPETHQLGTYLGVRAGGRLVAMAGERLRAAGAAEISAVCTHPDYQRRGLGAALTAAMVEVIRARGDLALLHVVKTNANAIRVYEQLGFRIRRELEALAARAATPSPL
jgi:ribosomal protein S18 acetylase RimI-like enzyme